MLNAILSKLAAMAAGKHILLVMAKVHNALDGHKSELLLALLAIVHLLKLAEVIPPEMADQLELAIGGGLTPALLARVKKVTDLVDGAVPTKP